MSWWNIRENVAKALMPKPTLGDKLTKEYKKKLRMRRRGKK